MLLRTALSIFKRSPSKALNVLRPSKVAKFFRHVEAKKRASRQLARSDWDHSEGIARRKYASYSEYVEHQKSKLAMARKDENVGLSKEKFVTQFENITEIKPGASVLCLGARTGAEVAAFISLGCSAIGIDLNPGENNPLVISGDFHNLSFDNQSMDIIYTNSLDHAYDLEKVIGEAARVLKSQGLLIVDVIRGFNEDHFPGDWEASFWPSADSIAKFIASNSDLEPLRQSEVPSAPDWCRYIFVRR